METVAVFPIPNSVAFPGQIVPLHVFEPRYRQLVKYCVDNGVRLAVAHVEKRIHKAKLEDGDSPLHHNLDTYAPKKVVSAGLCEIIETFPDGRIAVAVQMDRRFALKSCQQMIPFMIYECEEIKDEPGDSEELLAVSRQRVLDVLRRVLVSAEVPNGDELYARFAKFSNALLSFKIFSLIEFDADFMQAVLMSQSPLERLQMIENELRLADVVQ